MEVAPYLLFLGNCKEAFEFYEKALGGRLDMMTFGQSPDTSQIPAAMLNQVIHARLASGTGVIMGSDCPPNGATSVEMIPVLMPTMPYSSASATRQTRAISLP